MTKIMKEGTDFEEFYNPSEMYTELRKLVSSEHEKEEAELKAQKDKASDNIHATKSIPV